MENNRHPEKIFKLSIEFHLTQHMATLVALMYRFHIIKDMAIFVRDI